MTQDQHDKALEYLKQIGLGRNDELSLDLMAVMVVHHPHEMPVGVLDVEYLLAVAEFLDDIPNECSRDFERVMEKHADRLHDDPSLLISKYRGAMSRLMAFQDQHRRNIQNPWYKRQFDNDRS